MFDQIFGNFLVSTNRLSEEQLQEILRQETTVRVKLGLIAVADKMMTQEQADEINHLQALKDKRFGDLAVMKGYLTEDQVAQLLKKQGNIYMIFVQTLIDKGFMTLEEIERALADYQIENLFTQSDMDDMISGDIDRVVRLFLPTTGSELYDKVCGIAIRTIIRLISSGAYVQKAYFVQELTAERLAMQQLEGDHEIYTGFTAQGDNLLCIADVYAQEKFMSVDLDALDAVGEFTNCINGLFASELSCDNVNVDMIPPQYYEQEVNLSGEQICVFPIIIEGKMVKFIISIDSDLSIN